MEPASPRRRAPPPGRWSRLRRDRAPRTPRPSREIHPRRGSARRSASSAARAAGTSASGRSRKPRALRTDGRAGGGAPGRVVKRRFVRPRPARLAHGRWMIQTTPGGIGNVSWEASGAGRRGVAPLRLASLASSGCSPCIRACIPGSGSQIASSFDLLTRCDMMR